MHEPAAYQAIEEAGVRVPSRAIITKLQLKQLVYSLVVITFVSVSAVTYSNVGHSKSVSTRDPSDSPVQSVIVFPITRAPTPTPTPVPTPPPTAVSSNRTPLMTPARPTPRPSASKPPVASLPGGDSSKAFGSDVDFTGKDDDGTSTTSSGSKASASPAPSSPAISRNATATTNATIGSGSTNVTTTAPQGAPPASTRPPTGADSPLSVALPSSPAANASLLPFPTAVASLAPVPATSGPAASVSPTSTAAPLSPASLAPQTTTTATPSVPTPGSSSLPSATPTPALNAVVTTADQSVRAPSQPHPTPQRTMTATINRLKASLTGARLPREVPSAVLLAPTASGAASRPSYLPTAAIQDERPASVDLVGVDNLREYPDMGCLLPNYVSKSGKLFAVGPAGETQALVIKGVNWFGMETDARIPYGLRTADQSGSTLFEIAAFLARNNFNSVRLAIAVDSVLSNTAPSLAFVNQAANLAIKVDSYMSTLESVVKALAFHHISVLLSLDIGIPANADAAAQSVDEAAQLDAIDTLTGSLCTREYWNVMGLDLQNEPSARTWGDGSATDFRAAATRLGNRMLEGCGKWLAFVEGNSERHEWTAPTTKKYMFDDWLGGGLSKAAASPVTLAKPDKVVYAPHYGSPSVFPASYFYQADGVSELSDEELLENVRGTFDLMFGSLAKEPGTPAIVLGAFGGLYASDKHPLKTTQRVLDFTVKLMTETSGVAGGYVWSLNPETGFDFNAHRAAPGSPFREGLVQSDWRTANEPLLAALEPLDALPGLGKLQCVKKAYR